MTTFPENDITVKIKDQEFDIEFNIDTFDNLTAEIWNLQIFDNDEYRNPTEEEFNQIVWHLETKEADRLNAIINQPKTYKFWTKLYPVSEEKKEAA